MPPENIAAIDFCFSSMMSPSGYLAKQPELRAMADSVFTMVNIWWRGAFVNSKKVYLNGKTVQSAKKTFRGSKKMI